MKDFNTIRINGQTFALKDFDNNLVISGLDEMLVLFIKQWINDEDYIAVKTSGSTGNAKTIHILKEKMLASAAMTCAYFKLTEKNTALLCMSAKHIGGMMMIVRAIYAKMNLISVTPSANPLENVVEQIDFTAMVPYQVSVSLEKNLDKLKDLKQLIIGGGTISFHLEEQLKKHQINAYHSFGMTETISHFALREINKSAYFTCLSDITVTTNAENALIITAPQFFETPLKTNDIVKLKDEKTFTWIGRKDFAIETGGLKVQPEELEKALAPYITQRFFVSSQPHKQLNNQLILIIEGHEYPFNESIFNHLEKYYKPKQVYFIPSFVETKSGKLDRLKTALLTTKKGAK